MAAINLKLKDKFNIDINENDVKEGFDRPSFFVKFDDLSKNDHLYNFERNITVRIYYFPTDRYKYQIEVLEVQQDIEDIFKLGIEVEERYLKIKNDIQSEIIDSVLMVTFDLSYFDSSYVETAYDKMKGVDIDV